MIDQDYLKEHFNYDPETGIFTVRKQVSFRCPPGYICGWKNELGYLHVRINFKQYKLHRLAWLYVYGEWPVGHIDHINGIPSDNRISNLRICTDTQNIHNRKIPKHNKSGYKGVHLLKGRYYARIGVNYKQVALGGYATAEEASAVYVDYAKKIHGEFFNESVTKDGI